MQPNALTVKVNDKSKTLRFSETLVAGSVYAVTVEGGADTCGASAVLALKIGDATVGWAELANGVGELSLLTQELATALTGERDGTRLPALAAIRCTDEGGDQVVAVGKADILFAGREWFETSDLARITSKGDKGDRGYSAYEIAVQNGYEGTEAQWIAALQAAATVAAQAANTAASAAEAAAAALQAVNALTAYTDSDAENVFEAKWAAAKAAIQTISAVWTFSSSPVVPAPTNNTDAATKKYVDDAKAAAVLLTGAQTVAGTKTFSSSPLVPTAATTDNSQKAASTAFVQALAATLEPRYPIVQKALSSGAVTLDDRAINLLTLGATTSATITFPSAVSGKSRDFWLVVTASTASSREIALSGGTCYGEHATTFELEEGTTYPNVLVFTEIGTTGVFIVRRRLFAVQSNTIT